MKKVRNIPLILGDKKFFNIEDLKNDFNVNDILSSYYNDSLKIWLSHKYNDLAQELVKIDKSESPKKIIEDIIRIFFKDDENLEVIVKDACFIIENTVDIENKDIKLELEDYINQYNSIADSIYNLDIALWDYESIKESIEKLYNEYNGLFNYYYEDFFYKFYNQKNYYVILSILANEDIRRIFFQNEKIKSDIDKMFTHLDISINIYRKFFINNNNNDNKDFINVNFILSGIRKNLLNHFGLVGNIANIAIDIADKNKYKNKLITEYKNKVMEFIYQIPKTLSIYLLYDIKCNDVDIFNEDELSILEKEFEKSNKYSSDFIFNDRYSDKENIVNFRKAIELFANEEKLNFISQELKNIIECGGEIENINKKVNDKLEFEIDNLLKDIKSYIAKETWRKHLFDFCEFGIFGECLSESHFLNKKIKKYKEYTEDNFKIVTDKKCLILHLDKNAVIKSLDNDKEYDIDSVNGYFPIFNGINYKGNKHYNELVYMEI